MQICRQMGWKLEKDWAELSSFEQEIWLDYEENRQLELYKFVKFLKDNGLYTAETAAIIRLQLDLA
jgi:hypothetical protein